MKKVSIMGEADDHFSFILRDIDSRNYWLSL